MWQTTQVGALSLLCLAVQSVATRGWELPSLQDVQAKSDALTASGFASVGSPVISKSMREAMAKQVSPAGLRVVIACQNTWLPSMLLAHLKAFDLTPVVFDLTASGPTLHAGPFEVRALAWRVPALPRPVMPA